MSHFNAAGFGIGRSDASEIEAGSAILDGEVVVPSASGVSDFSVLQNELKGRSSKIVLVTFDLLYLNGRDLRKLPLLARKAELKQIIDGSAVQFSDSFEIDGQEMYQHACKLGPCEVCRREGATSLFRGSARRHLRPIGGKRWQAASAQRSAMIHRPS